MVEADLVEELVSASGATKAELCRRSGLSRALLDDYLKGSKVPSLRQLRRIADAAGLELAVKVVDRELTDRPPVDRDRAAAVLAQVCEAAEHLPRRAEVGPLRYPPFRTLVHT